jgi:hypothetical protein
VDEEVGDPGAGEGEPWADVGQRSEQVSWIWPRPFGRTLDLRRADGEEAHRAGVSNRQSN